MAKILNKKEINKNIAKLESQVDFLEKELSYIQELLVNVGFEEGISTLKQSALELLDEMAEEKKF